MDVHPYKPVLSPLPDLLWLSATVGASFLGLALVSGLVVVLVLAARRAARA
jgi:hypothetical protein